MEIDPKLNKKRAIQMNGSFLISKGKL